MFKRWGGGIILSAVFFVILLSSNLMGAPAKKALLVIPPMEFSDIELFKPKEILEKSGIKVVVTSFDIKQVTGMERGTAIPDIAIKDVKIADYDLIAIIGGTGTIHFLWDNAEVHSMIRVASEKGKYIAAICAGPVVLAHAGILKGKKVTANPGAGIPKEIHTAGGIYIDKAVVVDGKIITGKNRDASEAFGKKLAEVLQ